MRRREFIAVLGGAAAWPLAARAQLQTDRVRLIGVLMPANEAPNRERYTVFVHELQKLGWIEGRNVHIEVRWSKGNAAEIRRYAAELVALAPDVVLATGSAMFQATRKVPIVFVIVADPVGGGFVKSLSRPGGNATGFMMFEYSLCAKWLELLKEITPGITRVAVLRDPKITAGIGQFAVLQSVAGLVGVEVIPVNLNDAAEIKHELAMFSESANGGLILTASPLAAVHRNLIITLAAQHKLPAVYPQRTFAAAGGLISYGPNILDQYPRAARYVDRILKGEKPADLPVQAPTKYELVINLKTARALGISIPLAVRTRADEVIE
jgi:ABC-type uncharacterized transport system substrate-binding protein